MYSFEEFLQLGKASPAPPSEQQLAGAGAAERWLGQLMIRAVSCRGQ